MAPKSYEKIEKHPNKRAYNYLAYHIGNKYLYKYSKYFKGKAIDLGCGSAPYKSFISKKTDSYTCLDWDNCLHNRKFDINADLNLVLPIDDNSFDTIFSFSVIEHLKDPQLHVNEAYRICKKDGVLYMQCPFQWQIHEQPYDFFRFTKYGIEHLLKKAGFRKIIIEAQSGFFTMLALKVNYFLTRFVKGPRILKNLIYFLIRPIWVFNQLIAPIMDNLDRTWSTETFSYAVIAFK